MALSLAQPLARGRTAEIFPWGSAAILKLYMSWCPEQWIENEIKASRAILEAGIPTPATGETVRIEGRTGLVFERVDGESMLDSMNRRPWQLLKSARTLAALQVRINQLVIDGFPPYKDVIGRAIHSSPYLSEPLQAQVLATLDALPDAHTVCHGDFHPGNVLLTAEGPIVIDWMTACAGNPWADVARTSLILTIGAKGAGKMLNPLFRFANGLYHRAYLDHYRSQSPDRENSLQRWLPVMAAARLNENIAAERDALLRVVRGGNDDE